jgi:hypothetical protein
VQLGVDGRLWRVLPRAAYRVVGEQVEAHGFAVRRGLVIAREVEQISWSSSPACSRAARTSAGACGSARPAPSSRAPAVTTASKRADSGPVFYRSEPFRGRDTSDPAGGVLGL